MDSPACVRRLRVMLASVACTHRLHPSLAWWLSYSSSSPVLGEVPLGGGVRAGGPTFPLPLFHPLTACPFLFGAAVTPPNTGGEFWIVLLASVACGLCLRPSLAWWLSYLSSSPVLGEVPLGGGVRAGGPTFSLPLSHPLTARPFLFGAAVTPPNTGGELWIVLLASIACGLCLRPSLAWWLSHLSSSPVLGEGDHRPITCGRVVEG